MLHYYRSFHFTFPKYMQLERLAPPIANNRRISCEEASRCRRSPCNGRRSRCRWHWRRISALCLWNLSLRTWKDILQSESTSSFGILGLELEGWTEERSYNHVDEWTEGCHPRTFCLNPCQGKWQGCSNFDCMANCTPRHRKSAILKPEFKDDMEM